MGRFMIDPNDRKKAMTAPTTFEAFILEAAGFRDHAEVSVWAHHPIDAELRLTIPNALGGTSPAIDFSQLANEPSASDARFTVDENMNVLAWRPGRHDHSAL
jgi:hypothetical protein